MKKKKSPTDRRGGLQGSRHRPRAHYHRKTTGTTDRFERWILYISAELSAACDRFWLRTEERRAIEMRRRANLDFGFGRFH